MNNVLIDWLSFTVRNRTYEEVIDLLGFDISCFVTADHSFYGYKDRLYFDGVNILWNGRTESAGVLVEMSGQGCRCFESYGLKDFMKLFEVLSADNIIVNYTRLDIAYDDFDGILPLQNLVLDTLNQNYVSRSRNWECILSSKGTTINHGSDQSNIKIRIYDKKAERSREDIEHWVRCELQIRRENVQGMIDLLLNPLLDIRECYFSVLNNYLRYIEHTDAETSWHSPMSFYWAEFVESWNSRSIFVQPGTEYNISHLAATVVHMYGNAINTLVKCVGVDTVLDMIHEDKKGKILPFKYQKILQEHGALAGISPASSDNPPKLTGG